MNSASTGEPAPVSPYLVVDDAEAAIDFYRRAFAAIELFRAAAEDGIRLLHASLLINGGHVMLSDEFPERGDGCRSPHALGGTAVTIHLATDDADLLWQRAVAAGAAVVVPLADQFWGERYGKVLDPFGHVWSIGSPLPQR